MRLPDQMHFINALPPVADAFEGTVRSDVINVKGEGILFILYKGVGTTGTSTITVNACDDVTPSNRTTVPFYYRANLATDVWAEWTAAPVTGFVTTAGSNHMYQILVDAAELAEEGRGYAELNTVQSVDSPVLGGIMAIVLNQRYAEQPETLLD